MHKKFYLRIDFFNDDDKYHEAFDKVVRVSCRYFYKPANNVHDRFAVPRNQVRNSP